MTFRTPAHPAAHSVRLALAATLLWAAGSTWAQSPPPSNDRYIPPPPADAALYQALGEKDGIARMVSDFVDLAAADPRISAKFKDVNHKELKRQISDQFCQLSGGPCRYEGESMRNSHADLKLQLAHFNALVEDLQIALDRHQVPFRTQNRLLALLAPMHRDIVTTGKP